MENPFEPVALGETYSFLEASRMWQLKILWRFIIRTSSKTILYHPLSIICTCLYTFVLVQHHVEPTESEDIPVGLLCLLVGFCGIASGVMQSNLFWRWKWLHKIKLRRDPALERVSCWLRVHFPACQQDDFLGAWFNLWDMILRLSQRKELFAGLAKEAETVWGKDGWNRKPPTKPLPIRVIRLDVSSLRLEWKATTKNS